MMANASVCAVIYFFKRTADPGFFSIPDSENVSSSSLLKKLKS
jgi:hypothetical protein